MSLFGQGRPFLDALSRQDRDTLLALGAPRAYEPGQVMLQERDTGTFVLAVRAGWSVVSVSTERGARLILALRGAGEVIGDLAAVDQGPRSATVTALGPVEATSISGERFRHFLSARPHATAMIMRQFSARLRSADSERRSLASETVLRRLAVRLLELAERAGRAGEKGAVVVELPLPQHDLASAVGATREAVAKALRLLREQDVVHTGNRRVTVTDMELLVLLAQGRAGPPGRTGPGGPGGKSPRDV